MSSLKNSGLPAETYFGQDPDLLLTPIGDIAKARGMAQIARDAGLGRESLYRALSHRAKPRFDTIMKVPGALGLKIHVKPA